MRGACLCEITNHAGLNSRLSQGTALCAPDLHKEIPFEEKGAKVDATTEIDVSEKLALEQGTSSFNFMLLMNITGKETVGTDA